MANKTYNNMKIQLLFIKFDKSNKRSRFLLFAVWLGHKDQCVSLATIISKEADNGILVRTSAGIIATNVLLLKTRIENQHEFS